MKMSCYCWMAAVPYLTQVVPEDLDDLGWRRMRNCCGAMGDGADDYGYFDDGDYLKLRMSFDGGVVVLTLDDFEVRPLLLPQQRLEQLSDDYDDVVQLPQRLLRDHEGKMGGRGSGEGRQSGDGEEVTSGRGGVGAGEQRGEDRVL